MRLSGKVAYVEWTRSYNGGSPQTFDVWVRDSRDNDFGWKSISGIKSNEEEANSNDEHEAHNFHLSELINPGDEEKMTYFFSVRARNKQGYSGFSAVVKLVALMTDTTLVKGSPITQYTDSKS